MPLLATFTFAGAASLAGAGTNCFAHGLPTTPDWALAIFKGTGAAAVASLPLHLVTRASNCVIIGNASAASDAELVAQFVHSINR